MGLQDAAHNLALGAFLTTGGTQQAEVLPAVPATIKPFNDYIATRVPLLSLEGALDLARKVAHEADLDLLGKLLSPQQLKNLELHDTTHCLQT